MSFPVNLTPSPVHEVLTEVLWDPLDKLELDEQDKKLLKAAEENVIEYTLASQEDASHYVQLLLGILDQLITQNSSSGNTRRSKSRKVVAKLPLDAILTDEDTRQLLVDDQLGVVMHYVVSKISEVVMSLRTTHKTKVTVASTFYPEGTLVENWRPLLRLLVGGGSDPYAQRGSALALACILLEGRLLEKQKKLISSIASILESFVSWMTSRLQSSTTRSLCIVTPSLTIIIVDELVRELFDNAGGIGYLARHLRPRNHSSSVDNGTVNNDGASIQQIYELCYCLWLMSFDCDTNERIRNHFHRDGAVAALVDLVAAAPREKIVRLALSTLRNLAVCTASSTRIRDSLSRRTIAGSAFLHEMVGCGLQKSIELLKARDFSDPEIVEDLDILGGLVLHTCGEMTRWDVYEAEVESGHLQWSMVHTEKFFRENARRMEGKDGDFSVVRMLIRLVSAEDEDVAAVACFDIGEFVRHYPGGKAIVNRLGAKDIILGLIDHPNPGLQRQALQCVSKMLVQNWHAFA